MPAIRDIDRIVFSNADKTIADNFTVEELARLQELAVELDAILKASNQRQQNAIKQGER